VKKPGKKTPSGRAAAGLAAGGPVAGDLAPGGARPEAPRWRAWTVQVLLVAGAAFLLYLGPLLAVGFAFVVLAERPSAVGAVLLLAAFIGCTLIVGFDPASDESRRLGNMFGLAAALCYALFIVANRKIPREVTPTTRACQELLLGTVVLLPFVPLGWETLSELYADLPWVLATAFVQGFLAVTLAVFALEFLKAYQYGIISYLEPVVAALVGALCYGETTGLLQGLAALLILTAGLGQAIALQRHDTEEKDG
jgi:drug/metabolite transporter (DMT)-like permease